MMSSCVMLVRALLFAAAWWLVGLVGLASAAVFTVNTTVDAVDASTSDGNCATAAGQCALRAAVQQADALGGTNTINVPAGVYVLTLGSALTTNNATNNLTIVGTGPVGTVIVDGGGLAGVLRLFGGTVTLDNVTIRNGSSGTTNPGAFGVCTGGGLFVGANATVNVTASVIADNVAPNASGGGICVGESGTLNLTASTVRDNTGTFGGGGIRVLIGGTAMIRETTISGNKVLGTGGNGGGIEIQGVVRVINSTVSGNSAAAGNGGGVALDSGDGFENLRLTNVTIANNRGEGQLGVFGSPAVVESTIIANPATGSNCVIAARASFTSNGHNLDSGNTCHFTAQTDRINTNPRLGPLARNGGPTRTHALQPGSPAIDGGDPAACPPTDQRGVPRPQDGDGGGAVCDIGAYEARGGAPQLLAAVLPASRSVQVGTTATAFASVINQGPGVATGCEISPVPDLPATFGYQTTDPITNQPIGTPNTPASIAAGDVQTFVFSLLPSAPIPTLDAALTFVCANADPAPVVTGLDTLLFSASAQPVPDIVALAATVSKDGIVNLVSAPAVASSLAASPVFVGAFAVATVNLGVGDSITVSANTGSAALPVTLAVCQTDPLTGLCTTSILPTVTTTINPNETPTFAVFVVSQEIIPFDPAGARIFVVFTGSDAVVRGSTSVAVRTE
jgi:CSLREA domain-containing protein